MPGLVILIVGAYFLGSIPPGFLIARSRGIDLRRVGSGNIGATNVSRALGRKWGYICFALDTLKGLAPTLAGRAIIGERQMDVAVLWLWLGAGCAAVLGHLYPVYLRFKGGKGIATGLGVILGLYPYYTVIGVACFVIWLICVLIWRYVSLASIAAVTAFPILLAGAIIVRKSWTFAQLWPLVVIAAVMPAILIYRHKANISRLIAGTENRAFQKKTNQ